MKYTFRIMFVAMAAAIALGMGSCSDDEFTESIFDDTEYPLDRSLATFPLDTFVKKNFLEPYNLQYLYKMQDIGSNMDYNLVPCTYDQSVNLAVLCKYLWYDVYKECVGEEFLKMYSPRIIHVIGSPAFNPSSGTMLLGTAEGGLKITLYNANALKADDIELLNEWFFKTMHHEFSHILNQRYNRPTDFDLISNGKYNTVSWQDTPDSVALSQGFISPYASSQQREDWVEVIANYIVKDTVYWNQMMETASYQWEHVTDVDATTFKSYFKSYDENNTNPSAWVLKSGINRDSVGYYVRVSSTSNGNAASYAVQRKAIQRDADNKWAVPDENGNIVYLTSQGFIGRDVIQEKLKYVRDWLQENFNYNLEDVRMGVQHRQWATDENGKFILDADGHFQNNLIYVRPDGTTVLDELKAEVEKYKELQK